jgi:hypothetical protein
MFSLLFSFFFTPSPQDDWRPCVSCSLAGCPFSRRLSRDAFLLFHLSYLVDQIKQNAKFAGVAVLLSRFRLVCRSYLQSLKRYYSKCVKVIARWKWESENMMQGVLPNLKIASREMTLRGWDDDLPTPIMIRGVDRENWFLTTCVMSDEIKFGWKWLSILITIHIFPSWNRDGS